MTEQQAEQTHNNLVSILVLRGGESKSPQYVYVCKYEYEEYFKFPI